jgi:hypothetical protein
MPRAAKLASLFGSIFTWSAMFSASVHAEATAPAGFCAANPSSPACSGASIGCDYCHTNTTPPEWNSYGLAIKAALNGRPFDANLAAAVAAVAAQDSDTDGVANGVEISEGTLPGNTSSVLLECDGAAVPPAARPYDFTRAFRRLHVLYCGRSPSFEEVTAFEALGSDQAARYAKIDAAVEACLQSDYWLDEGLQRLGDVRIRPNKQVGRNGTARLVIIGDYEWDYRLWTYVLSGDRDMRDLLLATYHVERGADGRLAKREGVIPEPEWAPAPVSNLVSDLIASGRGSPQGQPLEPEKRAGMITTSWFIAQNTMFSPLPRTTAAQALRAYLGQDIALGQGLMPVNGEPLDIDQRGVRTTGCSDCHSTLDPLAYAFTWYNGISGRETGKYSAQRPTQITGWTQNVGSLLGQPIRDAQDFAKVAVASELFPRNLATMFLRHAIERSPTSAETDEFEELWRSVPADGWSANKLIHRIVRSSFFGGGK